MIQHPLAPSATATHHQNIIYLNIRMYLSSINSQCAMESKILIHHTHTLSRKHWATLAARSYTHHLSQNMFTANMEEGMLQFMQ
jgi:hypothetical protein